MSDVEVSFDSRDDAIRSLCEHIFGAPADYPELHTTLKATCPPDDAESVTLEVHNPLEWGVKDKPLMVAAHEHNRVCGQLQRQLAEATLAFSAQVEEWQEAVKQREFASKLLEDESRDSVKIAEELFRVTKHRDACEVQFQAKVNELGKALEQRNRLADILDSFPYGLHPADERGPCLCLQCKFLRDRDAARVEMRTETSE